MKTTEKKKRQAYPFLPKPCGFRVNVGDYFWYMTKDANDNLIADKMQETDESLFTTIKGTEVVNKSSVQGILAENGNYYMSEEDCLNRIEILKNRKA